MIMLGTLNSNAVLCAKYLTAESLGVLLYIIFDDEDISMDISKWNK